MYFDSHAHLSDPKFDPDRSQLIEQAREQGVELILNPGSDLYSSQEAAALAKEYNFIYAAVGIHPHDAKEVGSTTFGEIEKLAQQPKVVAIGEIGLDYHYDFSPRDVQRMVFERQILMANGLKYPIIVHSREAHEDTYRVLKEHFKPEGGGVMHSFSGSVEMAKRYIDLGLYLSISGPVTFKNARKTVEVVKEIPLEHLLIETDSPYLTPVPFRGKRNHPALVKYVAEKIAEIKGISVEEVARKTTENGMVLFGIPS